MEHLLFISLIFMGILQMGTITTARHTALVWPTEVSWHKLLPNTPIPDVMRDGATVSGIEPDAHNFRFYNVASMEMSEDLEVSPYFTKKDLHPGTVMTLDFASTVSTSASPFLPRKLVDAIPFSTNKLLDILNHLAIRPATPEAKAVEGMLYVCEQLAFEGETRYFATSLESMLDYAISELKSSSVTPFVTTAQAKSGSALKQRYMIAPSGVRRIGGEEMVVCHLMSSPYAVFFCHRTQASEAYMIEMVGEDGTKVVAPAVCHTDTSKWNPDHLVFQVLKVRPGMTVCHILQRDILWAAANYK